MGQQQLLLLVLATVIVGLATVAGIQAFEQGSKRANQDAMTQTAVKMASDIQAHLQEPEPLGGAGLKSWSNHGSSDTPALSELGYSTKGSTGSNADFSPKNSEVYETTDGECGITSNSDPVVTCESADAEVQVTITGLDADGISTTKQSIKS